MITVWHSAKARPCGVKRARPQATCSRCRRHRIVHELGGDGRVFCEPCSGPNPAHYGCPDCGNQTPGRGKAPCHKCAARRRAAARTRLNLELLEQPWVRNLFLEFCGSDLLPKEIGRVSARIDAYAVIFWKIDLGCDRMESLNQIKLFELLGREGLRRSFHVVNFLCERAKIEWSYQLLTDLTELNRQRAILEAVRSEPWGTELRRYAEKLWTPRTAPLSARTQRSYLTAATGLMKSSGIPAFREVRQRHVDKYLLGTPGQSASLQSFLNHLNEEYGSKLRGGKIRRSTAEALERKLIARIRMALNTLTHETSMHHRQAAFVTLASLCNQIPAEHILSIRANINEKDKILKFIFGSSSYFDVNNFLTTIEQLRKIENEGELLFAGRNLVQPRSPEYLRYYSRHRRSLIP